MSKLLGRVSIDGQPAAELHADGTWVPVGEDELHAGLCELLNIAYSPLHPAMTDTQLAFGWGPLKRLQDVGGAEVEILAEPTPLPEGAIS